MFNIQKENKLNIDLATNKGEKLLTPFQRSYLLRKMQDKLPKHHRQRIQIMLYADEGVCQAEICRTLKCCSATVRHWTHVARAGMAQEWQDCPIGRPKVADDKYLEKLKELVSNSPHEYGYSFQCWTGTWLSKQLAKEFGVELSGQHINRLLKQIGFSARPKASTQHTNLNVTGKGILIDDLQNNLQSENISDYPDFLSINILNLNLEKH